MDATGHLQSCLLYTSHVPSIVKKKDGYEVVGKGTPIIYINGRKMQKDKMLRDSISGRQKDSLAARKKDSAAVQK